MMLYAEFKNENERNRILENEHYLSDFAEFPTTKTLNDINQINETNTFWRVLQNNKILNICIINSPKETRCGFKERISKLNCVKNGIKIVLMPIAKDEGIGSQNHHTPGIDQILLLANMNIYVILTYHNYAERLVRTSRRTEGEVECITNLKSDIGICVQEIDNLTSQQITPMQWAEYQIENRFYDVMKKSYENYQRIENETNVKIPVLKRMEKILNNNSKDDLSHFISEKTKHKKIGQRSEGKIEQEGEFTIFEKGAITTKHEYEYKGISINSYFTPDEVIPIDNTYFVIGKKNLPKINEGYVRELNYELLILKLANFKEKVIPAICITTYRSLGTCFSLCKFQEVCFKNNFQCQFPYLKKFNQLNENLNNPNGRFFMEEAKQNNNCAFILGSNTMQSKEIQLKILREMI